MFTLNLEGSIVIDKPLEEVWAFMDDSALAGDWQPYLVELRRDPPDQSRVGKAQFYTFQYLGRRIDNHYVVTEHEPISRTAYRSLPGSSIQATGETRFESVEAGTRLTMEFEPEIGGFFGIMPKPIVTWTYRRTLTQNMSRIKTVIEAAP